MQRGRAAKGDHGVIGQILAVFHRMDAGGVGHVFIDHFRQAKGRADGIQIQCAANGAVQRGA